MSLDWLDAKECAACAEKPGAPELCPACLENRRVVAELKRQRDEANNETHRRAQAYEKAIADLRRKLELANESSLTWRNQYEESQQHLESAVNDMKPLLALLGWLFSEATEDGFDLDGGSVQDKLLELRFLVETKYDPAQHGDLDSEPGDTIYVLAPEWEEQLHTEVAP